MARMTTYNPRKVTCALGNHIVTGFADDSFISIEYAGDGTSHTEGADGEVVRSIDPSRLYTVKISLQQNSRTNAYLQKMYERDQTDGGEHKRWVAKKAGDIRSSTFPFLGLSCFSPAARLLTVP